MTASERRGPAAGGGVLALVLCTGLLLLPLGTQAADLAAGKAKSARCAACHGAKGIAVLPQAPNLAGQNPVYLAKALHDFKSGARKDDMMTAMAAPLSDADIENLAAFYESLGTAAQ